MKPCIHINEGALDHILRALESYADGVRNIRVGGEADLSRYLSEAQKKFISDFVRSRIELERTMAIGTLVKILADMEIPEDRLPEVAHVMHTLRETDGALRLGPGNEKFWELCKRLEQDAAG